jgi:hypothetical protein
LLLANAPTAIHKLVRENAVASTLAIEEIRTHGSDKALERLQKGLVDAKAAGKTKVTRKHLGKPVAGIAAKKISEVQAKQLLQALQSVLHDPLFGKLSPGTMAGVHAALTPLKDLLDALPSKAARQKISTPNQHGVYTRQETIKAPLFKRSGKYPYEIHLARVAADRWIYSTSYSIGTGSGSSPCTLRDGEPTYPTRGQAIRAAVMHITREMDDPRKRDSKEAPSIHAWLTTLWHAPDPDWTEEMAASTANKTEVVSKAAWPFPSGGRP